METPRRAPLRSCRQSKTPDAPMKPPNPTPFRNAHVRPLKILNPEAMLKDAENFPDDLKTYLKTLDIETFGFVTFCLSELTKTMKSGCWFCSSMEKAAALARSMKMLCDARVTLNTEPESNSYDFFAEWTHFYHGVPKIRNTYV